MHVRLVDLQGVSDMKVQLGASVRLGVRVGCQGWVTGLGVRVE